MAKAHGCEILNSIFGKKRAWSDFEMISTL